MAFNALEEMDFPEELINDEIGELIELDPLEDGTRVYESKKKVLDQSFYRNLAEDLSPELLTALAEELLREIDADIKSRQGWDQAFATGLKYLGYTVEEYRSIPFMTACAAFDSNLSSSLVGAWAGIRAELLPATGPASTVLEGPESYELLESCAKVKKFLNNYLTIKDASYYSDCDIFYLYTAFVGNGFKKVWQDPVNYLPRSRNIPPFDMIVDSNCSDLLSSCRITHHYPLTEQEILLKVKAGEFIDIERKEINDDLDPQNAVKEIIDKIDGITKSVVDNKSVFAYYEMHTTRCIDGLKEKTGINDNEFPLPYKITIDKLNRKIVSIVRNWKEGDDKYERLECFVHAKYLPGFGLYGYGLIHLIGSNSITLTQMLRQSVDAATLSNFPAFLKVKGLKMENNDKLPGPGEAYEIETGGSIRLQDAIMPLPYKGADPGYLTLRKELKDESAAPAGVAEAKISEKHSDAAVGTILALMEKSGVIQSSVMRCLHKSLSIELQLIYNCFKEYMSDEPHTFNMKGERVTITKLDFHDNIRVVPVSDADLDTMNQRALKAWYQLQIAERYPQYHNVPEILTRLYSAFNIQDIDKIVVRPEEAVPLDPITENMNSMMGKPLKASLEQNHDAHIAVHSASPNAEAPDMAAHIQTHMAMKYLLEMQQLMGIQLPPPEQLQDVNIQNQIAMLAAPAAQELAAQRNAQKDPTPQQVLVMDIEQRDRAAQLKNEETKMKVEADSMKAGMQFETEMAKLRAQVEMAEEKNEKDLEVAEMRLEEKAHSKNRAILNKGSHKE